MEVSKELSVQPLVTKCAEPLAASVCVHGDPWANRMLEHHCSMVAVQLCWPSTIVCSASTPALCQSLPAQRTHTHAAACSAHHAQNGACSRHEQVCQMEQVVCACHVSHVAACMCHMTSTQWVSCLCVHVCSHCAASRAAHRQISATEVSCEEDSAVVVATLSEVHQAVV